MPKLDQIDPRRMKLRELAAVEKVVGRPIAGEMEAGSMGIDVMQGFVWAMLCRADGIRISATSIPEDALALMERAEDLDMETLQSLFEDEDQSGPPADLQGPDPTQATPNGGGTSDGYSDGGSWSQPPSSSTSGD
jgi:hypothetical protein